MRRRISARVVGRPRPPAPQEAECAAVPGDHGIRLDENEGVLPAVPMTEGEGPQSPLRAVTGSPGAVDKASAKEEDIPRRKRPGEACAAPLTEESMSLPRQQSRVIAALTMIAGQALAFPGAVVAQSAWQLVWSDEFNA